MSIIPKLVYLFLKVLVISYQRIFYPFTKVENKQHLDFDGPGVLVSNHPNTLTDPLHVLSRVKRFSHLLVNAGMFENPFANWFLSRVFCIPVKRPGRDTGKRKVNNVESFAKAYAHLSEGKMLYVAPEGSSFQERGLRPLKTGTARITLGAEAENDFNLGIRIVPVGVNYDDPSNCGSGVFMRVGAPLFVKDFQSAYEENPKKGAAALTQALEKRMKDLLICPENEAEEECLNRLEKILQHDAPLAVDKSYYRTRQLLVFLQTQKEENPTQYDALLKETNHYYSLLQKNDLKDRGFSQRDKKMMTIPGVLGFPIWLYGKINHLLAIEIPRLVERKLDLYKGYTATVKILMGLFTFPLSYWLQYVLFKTFICTSCAWLYLLTLPFFGILAWQYMRYMRPRMEAFHFRNFTKKQPLVATELLNLRGNLKRTIAQ